MRVLLINPSQEKVYGTKMPSAYPSLGLLYIGSVLKKEGHEVRLADIDTENIDEAKFKAIFEDFNPEAVGLTSTTPTFKNALKWAGISKRLNKDLPIVLGGVHATTLPREVIAKEEIDIVVVGEGEFTAKELFNRLSQEAKNLNDIKGIYFKRGNNIITNDWRPLIDDLDSLPFPDRTLLKRPLAFMPPDATHLPVATIMTSRGCPGKCTFCGAQSMFSRRFRARSVANIIEEVGHVIETEDIKEIHIIDDAFTTDKQRVLEFCEEINRKNINVSFQLINGLRADFVDRRILQALKDIGMKTVGYGVETGNINILKNIKKNIPFYITENAFKISKELGFTTWAFLIFGLPGETEETIKETIAFTKKLDPDFAKFLVLKPYPGSEVHAQLEKDNLLLSRDYDEYGVYTRPVHKLPGLEPEKMTYWQKKAFWEFYLRPRKIISHIARIGSWTRLKLMINDVFFALHLMFKK